MTDGNEEAKEMDEVKRLDPTIFTKSGIMVGLGEGKEEVLQVMDDLRSAPQMWTS